VRYVIFGDESTLPKMQEAFGSDSVLSVVASNRPQSRSAISDSPAVIQPAKASFERKAFVERLRAAEAEVFVCFSYSMILDPEILAIPPLGAINIHGGLLPSHRGANALNWVLVEGATTTGVTAHYMTTGIDEGDIIFQSQIPILDEDSAATLKQRLDGQGLEMLMRIRSELNAGGALPRIPQDPTKARYYRRRKPEDGRINWTVMSDLQVFNLIRALVNPWSGAFCLTPDGERVVFDRYYTLSEVAALRRRYGR
jgi:methionyl-tRNA formyltransferase